MNYNSAYNHKTPQSSKNIDNLRDKDKERKEEIKKQVKRNIDKGRVNYGNVHRFKI